MPPFWPISHTADLGLRIRAGDLAALFIEAAKGLVLFLVDEFPVQPILWREIELEAPDEELLLADFLSEILALAVIEGLAAVKVEVDEVRQNRLQARLGLKPVSELGGLKQEIKAVTYHGLEIRRRGGQIEAQVIFDV